jgi:hypothetical protein
LPHRHACIPHASLIAPRQRQIRKNIPDESEKVTASQDDGNGKSNDNGKTKNSRNRNRNGKELRQRQRRF